MRANEGQPRRQHIERERPIHLAILAYLRFALPGAAIHHSAQGLDMSGGNVARQVAKAKHMGMMTGWPDIEAFYKGRAMFFEVKAEGGVLSDAQRAVSNLLVSNGAAWAMVRSVDDARDALALWGVETAERRQ